MRARGWSAAVLAVVCWSGIAVAEPKPEPIDIKPFKDKLTVLKDASGAFYVVTFDHGGVPYIFYGTAKLLYEQPLEGSRSRNGTAWSVSIWAPRLPFPFQGTVEYAKDGTFRTTCTSKLEQGLTVVTGEKATEILDKGKFMTTAVTRRPLLLARDDRGIYYYVDVLSKQYGGNGHRVFIGKKGAMKQIPISDVATDSGGDVFSTKTGDLRLVRNLDQDVRAKVTTTWIKGEKRTELITLDPYMNQPLIYRDLGVYKLHGTICGRE
ncbi:MAG: hypothetical protein H0T89_21620 [Deltaproteobacteria bacterium]|nr:hypothetical protein [Deltaproteobacteria bacterium]MDQ3300876.1 hypothetical protein [Myxococcota bacterium]